MLLRDGARELLELGMDAELRCEKAAEVLDVLVGERDQLGTRLVALVRGKLREHLRDARLELDLLLVLLGRLERVEERERFLRLAGPGPCLGDDGRGERADLLPI